MDYESYMLQALTLAREAYDAGEVPVGCVIAGPDGSVIGRGRNRRQEKRDATAHAEVEAIREACGALGDWRLEGCTLYVTLEPCQMCAGALVQSRMDAVVIGCMSPKSGSAGSLINVLDNPSFNHQVEIRQGVLAEECSALLTQFFKELRVRVKEEKAQRETER